MLVRCTTERLRFMTDFLTIRKIPPAFDEIIIQNKTKNAGQMIMMRVTHSSKTIKKWFVFRSDIQIVKLSAKRMYTKIRKFYSTNSIVSPCNKNNEDRCFRNFDRMEIYDIRLNFIGFGCV